MQRYIGRATLFGMVILGFVDAKSTAGPTPQNGNENAGQKIPKGQFSIDGYPLADFASVRDSLQDYRDRGRFWYRTSTYLPSRNRIDTQTVDFSGYTKLMEKGLSLAFSRQEALSLFDIDLADYSMRDFQFFPHSADRVPFAFNALLSFRGEDGPTITLPYVNIPTTVSFTKQDHSEDYFNERRRLFTAWWNDRGAAANVKEVIPIAKKMTAIGGKDFQARLLEPYLAKLLSGPLAAAQANELIRARVLAKPAYRRLVALAAERGIPASSLAPRTLIGQMCVLTFQFLRNGLVAGG